MVSGQRGVHAGVIDDAASDAAAASSDATPDRWLALSVDWISPLASELLVEPLLGLGARGVQEIGGRLIAYVPPPVDPEAFVRQAQDVLQEATGLDHIALTWRWQEHRDWSVLWRQGLGPRPVTDRLVVTPSWCEAEAPEGAVVVTIDPGMAFGTAEEDADVTPDWLYGRGPFDGILANIHTGVLVPLLESFAAALRSGGWMILSGITEEEWRGVSRSAALLGFGLEDVDEEGGWRTGWFRRRVD